MIAGLELLALGMGIVFSFLIFLVFSMLGMSKLVQALDSRRPVTGVDSGGGERGIQEPDAELVSVIAAAVRRYRATRR